MAYGLGLLAFGLICSLLAGPVVLRWLLRLAVVDKPNERSSHLVPTPRGGGVALLVPFHLVCWYLMARPACPGGVFVIWFCALVLMVVSFVDDFSGVPVKVRFLSHVGASAALFFAFSSDLREWTAWLPMPIVAMAALFWMSGYTNAFNFMDGINGIAAGQAAMTGIGTGMIALLGGVAIDHPIVAMSLVIAGGALGFLPYNVPKARMFMGDVGSATLGFLLSGLAVWVVSVVGIKALPPLVALHLNFGMDTGITLFRRLLRGDRLHEAHREHFYQRLVRSGLSHCKVTGAEMLIQLCVLVTIPIAFGSGVGGLMAHLCICAGCWGWFFIFSEKVFRERGGAA